MADLKSLKNISDADRKLIEEAETLLGPEPSTMGFMKNLFWGNCRQELVFPYPEQDPKEAAECDQLLARLDEYLRTEHPAILIDQEQHIPQWVIDRLFKIGALGMTIPKEFGGLGLGITSYNRVLERVGKYCGSTAVLLSAHLSIGCGAVKRFGTPEQKAAWLPHLASNWLSAFCLSEPNVGCDAGGQETTFEKTADGEHFIINGEKKWATSGALAGLFTVMAREKTADGKGRISALVCHPDMPGVEIFQKNRSKCGIRGTWQARIRFHNVKVPKFNLLHTEGKGLNVALECLNFGRCTLSAGMLGGAKRSMDQAVKWSQTRYQFKQPLSAFELVRARIAHMAALTYAMEAVLYATTGMLDRKDDDIMVETAACKVINSEFGWQVVNDAMQIMGGESYMVENEIERVFRDSRINLIVEGANEVMQSFIFAYGGKKLAEGMLDVKDAVTWNGGESFGANFSRISKNLTKWPILRTAMALGAELFLGIRKAAPVIDRVQIALKPEADRLAGFIREHSHQFKQASKRYEEAIVTRQAVQARLADNAIWLHAWACTLSKLDLDLRKGAKVAAELERDRAAAEHFFDLAEQTIRRNFRDLYVHTDDSMLKAADAALKFSSTLPNGEFSIPERSPVAQGTGRTLRQEGIRQFPGSPMVPHAAAPADAPAGVGAGTNGAH